MAQQKKNGIQPISYSRLHEKLGESNRKVRELESQLAVAKHDFKRKANEAITNRKAYYDMKEKRDKLRKDFVIYTALSTTLIAVLIASTIYV